MSELLAISGCDRADRSLDLIFIHGLDGDGRSTWQKDDDPKHFWPGWLGEEYPNIGVWSLDYEASSLKWKGQSMPLFDRAGDVLDCFELSGIGQRPIGFVCHSLGGLLAKQLLRSAKELNNPNWKPIADQARFIVFLSTPHSGSDLANWINYLGKLLGASVSVQELEAHNPGLRQLNTWYRNSADPSKIKTYVYFEKYSTNGILVVNETSADPGITGVHPIAQDADHISICKPDGKTKSVYKRVKQCIQEVLASQTRQAVSSSYPSSPKSGNDPLSPINAAYSGKLKLLFCDRLGTSWRDLADLVGIKPSEQAQFAKGLEPRAIWEWLWQQERLAELPGALDEIGRNDLAKELNRHPD